MVSTWVRYYQQSRLFECSLNLVSKRSWCKSSGNSHSTGVCSKFQYSTLKRPSINLIGDFFSKSCQLACPNVLFDSTHTSVGFSMAAMTRAAISSFSQVFFKLIIAVPIIHKYSQESHLQYAVLPSDFTLNTY